MGFEGGDGTMTTKRERTLDGDVTPMATGAGVAPSRGAASTPAAMVPSEKAGTGIAAREVVPDGVATPAPVASGSDAALDRLPARGLAHGLLRRDGEVVGCWWCDAVRDDGTSTLVRTTMVVSPHLGEFRGDQVWIPVDDGFESTLRLTIGRLQGPGRQPVASFLSQGGGFGLCVRQAASLARGTPADPKAPDRRPIVATGTVRSLGRRERTSDLVAQAARARSLVEASLPTLRAYVGTLDADAVDLLLRPGSDALHQRLGENWSALDERLTPGRPLWHALHAHPHAAFAILDMWLVEWTAVRNAVRSGRLDALLAEHLVRQGHAPRRVLPCVAPVGEALARRAAAGEGAKALHRGWRAAPDPAVRVAALLGRLPVDWWPRGDAQWDAFAACAPAVSHALEHLGRLNDDADPEADAKGLLRVRGGDWVAHARRHRSTDPGAVTDVDDLVHAYVAQVLGPAFAMRSHEIGSRATGEAARRVLFARQGLRRILETSDAWHRTSDDALAVVGALSSSDGSGAWPPAFPDHRDGSLALRVLVTPAQLVSEGAPAARGGLSHCVGGHAARCMSGHCRIGSVVRVMPDGTERRASTVEIRMRGNVPVVSQHRGPSNAEPPRDCSDFVDRYAALLADGSLTVAPSDLAPLPFPEGDGYDWAVPGNWETVRDLWRPFVPRRHRDLGAGPLVEAALATLAVGRRPAPVRPRP